MTSPTSNNSTDLNSMSVEFEQQYAQMMKVHSSVADANSQFARAFQGTASTTAQGAINTWLAALQRAAQACTQMSGDLGTTSRNVADANASTQDSAMGLSAVTQALG